DIKNKKTGGEDASVQERRKGELRDERDKKKYKDNKGNEILNATQEEKKKNEDEIKRLQEEEKELEDASTREYISEDQREIFYREAEKENKELQKMKSQITEEAGWRPIDFLAQQERRSANQESSKKYDTTNEDELIAYKQNAIRRDNVTDAAAVCLQAARVSHLNELINTTKATEDWYEDSETGEMTTKAKEGSRLVFKAGDELSAGIEGLHVFVKEIFEKKFNYGKQASLALENDLSNIAESVSHWTFGQAVGSRPDGQFYQRKREEQQTRCYTERSKRDFEKLYREGNRLSIGTEEWIDQKDHSKGRKAIVNEYAAMEMMNKWDKLKSLADRGRFNVSASEHLMQFNKPLIDRIQQSAYSTGREGDWRKFYGDLQSLGGKAGEVRDLTNAIRDMNKMLKGINLLKQR
ncbi:hypothetical protein KKC60_00540, partial [Patescibacteria group bacterium]|nr:hypothetical protein [Patescibacteria group bacterium]